jgi:hypothetical protein
MVHRNTNIFDNNEVHLTSERKIGRLMQQLSPMHNIEDSHFLKSVFQFFILNFN